MDKLLLIDDETDVQYSFRRIFDSPEIELTTATSGEEGLRIIPKLKPNLVIMDIRMGGINGLETLRRLRQLDAKLPVIMMTAYGTTQTAIEAMKLGAYDYLLKPFDVPKLKQIVFDALKAARAMKQVVSYQPLLESEDYDLGIVGRCEQMQNVFKLIGQLSASDATALITGESGTGKSWLPAPSTITANAPAGRSSPSTARRFPKTSSKVNSSGTSVAHSRVPRTNASESSSNVTTEPFSSMRSGT